jgi:hypothetical protein
MTDLDTAYEDAFDLVRERGDALAAAASRDITVDVNDDETTQAEGEGAEGEGKGEQQLFIDWSSIANKMTSLATSTQETIIGITSDILGGTRGTKTIPEIFFTQSRMLGMGTLLVVIGMVGILFSFLMEAPYSVAYVTPQMYGPMRI